MILDGTMNRWYTSITQVVSTILYSPGATILARLELCAVSLSQSVFAVRPL